MLSVIVTAYNISSYLPKCIESIIAQNYRDIEIIIVNDGSTDDSLTVMNSYAEIDSRIIVLDKNNGGLSSARNLGLDVMRGDYLTFVDGDDWLSPQTFDNVWIMEDNPDIDMLVFPTIRVSPSGELLGEYFSCKEDRIVENDSLKSLSILADAPIIACSKLYKRKVYKNIRFPLGCIHEDEWIVPQLNEVVDKIFFSKKGLYYYVQRAGSIMNSGISLDKTRKILDAIRNNFDYQYNSCGPAIRRNVFLRELKYIRMLYRELPGDSSLFPYFYEYTRFLFGGNIKRVFYIDNIIGVFKGVRNILKRRLKKYLS